MSKKRLLSLVLAVVLCVTFVVSLSACKKDGGSSEPAYVNPLTGVASEKAPEAGRPLVVSIDNVGDAVPQSWLSKADMVYEFPVEGKQTRLQAVYFSEFPEAFGPVRSVRPYFVDLAREYKAIHLGHGWSPEAQSYLTSNVVPYINAMNSDVSFYRNSAKAAPHNSYVKWESVKAKIDEMGWWEEAQDIEPFNFLGDGEEAAGKGAVKVYFNYSSSKCEFTYDAEKNTYVRTVGGREYVDLETGEPIETTNILVQKVSSQVLDDKGRLRIDMCAGGEAMLFTNGKVIKGTWERADLDSRTIFKDKDGNQFKLGVGKTWVEIADQNCSITYDAPAEEEK